MARNRLLVNSQLLPLQKLLAHKIDAQRTKHFIMHTTSKTNVASDKCEGLAIAYHTYAWRARREQQEGVLVVQE